MKFTIAIEPGTKKTAYGVVVPDLPGCFSAGDTIDEAFDGAREAIDLFCKILAEDGKDLTKASPLSKWEKDPEYKGWIWGVVEVPVERYFGPAERINITIPALTLKRIDEFAERKGETRSGFLVKAAESAMQSGGCANES
jgi:predicted RNase H-like HicB family nuclease